ncbi:MAG: hypothetical protein HRU27_08780 [Rhizobiaceae bacterium]|nr:hypothetical protein [Hyphomicrobiales bacterium]NRB30676.1 hypothetical protein [Rhizobiaceae bacterium]
MIKHIVDDLYQIGESAIDQDGWCEAVRIYVALNDGHPLLFDAGSHIHRGQIMADLKELLGDAAPGHIFLTHTELPHTGNLSAILEAWPGTKFVVSSGILPHVEMPWWVKPEQIEYAHAGACHSYGSRQVSFSDAILKDQPGTQWMFDERTGSLFTGDAFGYLFPEACDRQFDDEMADGVPVDYFRRYHESAFRFLPMVSGDKVKADLAKVMAKRQVNVIAPTHGNAIRGDVPKHVARVNEALSEICQ